MQNIDFSILKTNVRTLMEKNRTTQDELADAIGISQSNLSKRLKLDDDSNRFTLEQACRIALFYDVPLDDLIGLKRKDRKQSSEEICRFFKELICHYKVVHFSHEVEEEIWTPINNGYDCDISKKPVTYDAFYFPNYITPPEYLDEFRMDDLEAEARANGNGLPENVAINNFLQRYIDTFEKYDSNVYDEEAYNILVEAYFKLLKK